MNFKRKQDPYKALNIGGFQLGCTIKSSENLFWNPLANTWDQTYRIGHIHKDRDYTITNVDLYDAVQLHTGYMIQREYLYKYFKVKHAV